MKFFSLLLIVFCSASAFAVQTKHCPDGIKVSLDQFTTLSEASVEPQFWDYTSESPRAMEAYKYLNGMPTKTVDLVLTGKYDAKCNYKQYKYSSKIFASGTLQGAHKKASLKLNLTIKNAQEDKNFSYIIYVPVKPFKDGKLEPKFDDAFVYYSIQYCDWGNCISDYVRIGTAKSSKIQDYNLERINNWNQLSYVSGLEEGDLVDEIRYLVDQELLWEDEGDSCGGNARDMHVSHVEKYPGSTYKMKSFEVTATADQPINYCFTTAITTCTYKLDYDAVNKEWIYADFYCDEAFLNR